MQFDLKQGIESRVFGSEMEQGFEGSGGTLPPPQPPSPLPKYGQVPCQHHQTPSWDTLQVHKPLLRLRGGGRGEGATPQILVVTRGFGEDI